MIDFALEAERSDHQPPRQAIFQAALLRFRPILMTTMAALLGGVPLALGTGTGSELRRPLGIAIVGGLIFSQVLTLYTTPVIYLAFDRLAKRLAGAAESSRPTRRPAASRGRASEVGGRVSLSAPFIARPIGTTLLTIAVGLAGVIALSRPAGVAAAAGGLPDDSGQRQPARREPRHDGLVGRDAARAAVRPHRRHHRDDVDEPARLDADHDAVRLEPEHRRRRTRRARGDQRRARTAAAEPAEQPVLPQDEPGRRADPACSRMTSDVDPGAADVRRRPRRSCSRRSRRCRASGRSFVGGGALPAVRIDVNPTVLNSVRPQPRGRARRFLATANVNEPRACSSVATGAGRSTPTISCSRPNDYRRSSSSTQRRARCSSRTSPTSRLGRGRARRRLRNGKPAVLLIIFRQPGANIIDTVDAITALLPALQASIPPSIDAHGRPGPRRRPSAPRSTTSRCTMMISIVLVILVVFVFLRSVALDVHPQHRRADLARSARSASCTCSATAWTTSR